MDTRSYIFMLGGFLLAIYSVIANDSIQTLGTFLESNKTIKRRKLALATSIVAVAVITYSRVINHGDIAWGRLESIPRSGNFTIWHMIAPLGLLLLTRYGVPVSTSLLILSVFAASGTITKMVSKSVMGYGIAFISAYLLRFLIVRCYEKCMPYIRKQTWYGWYKKYVNRTYLQWISTGYLRSVRLMHDMANISVYLPRQLSLGYLLFTLVLVVAGLFYIFRNQGGTIQHIVSSKIGTSYIKSATIIDFVYACILLYFKELNSIPMSTTWVFVGLLAGREIALSHFVAHGRALKKVFPLLLKDLAKVIIGLVISIALAFLVGTVSGV